MNCMLKRIVHEREASANIPPRSLQPALLEKANILTLSYSHFWWPKPIYDNQSDHCVPAQLARKQCLFSIKTWKTSDLCMYCFLVEVVASSQGLNLVFVLVFPSAISNTVFLIYQCKEEFWGKQTRASRMSLEVAPVFIPKCEKN